MSYLRFLPGMYTANSMNCLTEVLGMGLPGNGTIPAVYSERLQLAGMPACRLWNCSKRIFAHATLWQRCLPQCAYHGYGDRMQYQQHAPSAGNRP